MPTPAHSFLACARIASSQNTLRHSCSSRQCDRSRVCRPATGRVRRVSRERRTERLKAREGWLLVGGWWAQVQKRRKFTVYEGRTGRIDKDEPLPRPC